MSDVLERLAKTIAQRRVADPQASYVAKLFAKGLPKIAQKVGEEAVETALAAVTADKAAVASESADLLFHLSVLWAAVGLTPAEVLAILEAREGTSGLAEKAARASE